MNDVHHRIDNAIRRYQSALLNDTKWREILQVVGKVGMPIQFSFVREEDFKVLVFFPEDGCLANMTRDCTVHGPFLLKHIFAIKLPRFELKQDPLTGRKYQDQSRFDVLIEALQQLGELPLEWYDDCAIIRGYRQ